MRVYFRFGEIIAYKLTESSLCLSFFFFLFFSPFIQTIEVSFTHDYLWAYWACVETNRHYSLVEAYRILGLFLLILPIWSSGQKYPNIVHHSLPYFTLVRWNSDNFGLIHPTFTQKGIFVCNFYRWWCTASFSRSKLYMNTCFSDGYRLQGSLIF